MEVHDMKRRMFGVAVIGLCGLFAAFALAACGSDDNNGNATSTAGRGATTVAPTKAATSAATSAPTAAATSASTATTPAQGGGTGAAIAATEKDFAITLDKTTAAAGQLTFNIQNNGPSTHEFVVIKTDLAPDQLPVDEDEFAVDEDAAGLTSVDEVEDIEANTSATLTVNVTAGRYVVICNLPAHYQQGMRAGFSVQ
jgi:uncharacterized cupredoxin-like copper-binding protein